MSRNGHWKDLGLVAPLAHASPLHQNKTVILAGGKKEAQAVQRRSSEALKPLGERAILEFVLHQLADQGLGGCHALGRPSRASGNVLTIATKMRETRMERWCRPDDRVRAVDLQRTGRG